MLDDKDCRSMQHNSVPPPPSLQSALQMDPNQQMQMQQHQQAQQQAQAQQQQQQQQQEQQQQSGSSSANKRRRRTDAGDEDSPSSSEPRRLRRSHEACARCRSKKIKASPAGRHRRQFPETDIVSCQVRLETSSLHCLRNSGHRLQSGG